MTVRRLLARAALEWRPTSFDRAAERSLGSALTTLELERPAFVVTTVRR